MSYADDIRAACSAKIPWKDLSGKNVLITGASGLIGSTLVELLMDNEQGRCHVYASGRNMGRMHSLFSRFAGNPYFHTLFYDVRMPLHSDIDFDIIIAGAGVASPQLYATDPVSVIKSNIYGVDNLLTYGSTHHLKQFLYVSSGEVYGEGNGRDFEENDSGYVNCATLRACYPSAKRASESLCIAYAHQYGIDVRICRPCHVYGPNFSESDNRVYAQFIGNVLRGEDIVMESTGAQFRSWCYAVDCASAILHIVLRGKPGEAYNIADETSNVSIKELAEMIADLSNKRVITNVPTDGESQGFNPVKRSTFSTKKLQGLGWIIKGSMKEKLQTTIDECKSRSSQQG